MVEDSSRVNFHIGSFGPFHELAAEVGDLVDRYEDLRDEFGDAHFHVQTVLLPKHAAFVEALAELVGGHVPLAYAVIFGAASRYFTQVMPPDEQQAFQNSMRWVLSSILDEAGPPPVSRDDVH